MSLLDQIKRNNGLAGAAAVISTEKLLQGDAEQALDFALASQRYRCEAREYSETLRICSEVRR